jgi:pimeloyl-ACP methyl ester carboxylesterase
MKVALLLPGYLDSPDYLHMKTFEKRLQELGYTVERIDPCNLWKTGDVSTYTITNFLHQIQERVESYTDRSPEEIILLGHSNGAFTAIVAGARLPQVTNIIALCPPADKKESARKWGENGIRTSKRDIPDKPGEFREFAIPASYIEDASQYSAVDEVKKILKTLMIFIALDDTVVPPQLTERIVANAIHPYVVRQPNMGHDFRHSQEQCNIVMEEIEKFLNK